MIDFANTRRGQIFFDSTLPEIARQLKRVADALEASNAPTNATTRDVVCYDVHSSYCEDAACAIVQPHNHHSK